MSTIIMANGQTTRPAFLQFTKKPEELGAFDTDFPIACIELKQAGTVNVVGADDEDNTGYPHDFEAGIHLIQVKRINSSGTTLALSHILLRR